MSFAELPILLLCLNDCVMSEHGHLRLTIWPEDKTETPHINDPSLDVDASSVIIVSRHHLKPVLAQTDQSKQRGDT